MKSKTKEDKIYEIKEFERPKRKT